MNDKEKYLNDINKRLTGQTKEILKDQVNLFYDENIEIKKNKYSENEMVKLKKGTFIHGIFGELENFDFTIKNGFISTDFTSDPRPNKICNSIMFSPAVFLSDLIFQPLSHSRCPCFLIGSLHQNLHQFHCFLIAAAQPHNHGAGASSGFLL